MVLSVKHLPWRVWVTRPPLSAKSLCEGLVQAGFTTETLPLIEIAPVSDETRRRAIQTQILDFDHFDAVFFVSINAVHEAMNWLDQFWPQLPIGIRYYAVGASTAKVLADYGIDVEEAAYINQGPMTSEALLEAPSLQMLEHQRFLIFRGVGGRDHMATKLRERGATVVMCELYERRLPVDAKVQWQNRVVDAEAWNSHYNVIALHSGESFNNWHELIQQLDIDLAVRESLLQTCLILPSIRLRDEAVQKGFTQIITATNATDEAVLEALIDAKRNGIG